MFRRSRVKIVAIIMAVSFCLLAGMLCVIYSISYIDMYNANQDMLERYIEDYNDRTANDLISDYKSDIPENDEYPSQRDILQDRPNMAYELSAFYSVKYDKDGLVTGIDSSKETIYLEEEIVTLAEEILKEKEDTGIYAEFSYLIKQDADGCLVVFMDNTIETESFKIILKYTLVFAGITLLVIFGLSCLVADKIVKPLEYNDIKQKQFLSDAGHELKTPISIVSINLEMLKRHIGDNKWLNNIEYETEKMELLIKQLMKLAKAENIQIKMESLNIGHILEGEILLFEDVAYEHGIGIIYEGIDMDVQIKGNIEHLKQLIAIFLDNAIEHSSEGADVLVSLEKQKNKVRLAVANKSAEILPEQKEQLFERFYRGDFSRNSESNHYGLGLSIAKAIVDNHKGDIKVNYESGYVVFEVLLPMN